MCRLNKLMILIVLSDSVNLKEMGLIACAHLDRSRAFAHLSIQSK